MQKLTQFRETAFAESSQYDTEIHGNQFRELGFTFDGTLSGSTTSSIDDDLYEMLGSMAIVQEETDLIKMRGASWRHLSAISNGGYTDSVLGFGNAGKLASASINLRRFARTGAIKTNGGKLICRGDFAALADAYAGGAAALTATLRPVGTSLGRQPEPDFVRPKFTERIVRLGTQNDDETETIRFNQPVRLAGIMLRALDGDVRVDGLIRNLSFEAKTADNTALGGMDTPIKLTWNQARLRTQAFARWDDAAMATSTGVVFVPFLDPTKTDGLVRVKGADQIVAHFDTSSAVEKNLTAVTQGGNEKVVMTLVAFAETGVGSGVGGAAIEVA